MIFKISLETKVKLNYIIKDFRILTKKPFSLNRQYKIARVFEDFMLAHCNPAPYEVTLRAIRKPDKYRRVYLWRNDIGLTDSHECDGVYGYEYKPSPARICKFCISDVSRTRCAFQGIKGGKTKDGDYKILLGWKYKICPDFLER